MLAGRLRDGSHSPWLLDSTQALCLHASVPETEEGMQQKVIAAI